MSKIIGMPLNLHDHNTFDGEFHNKYERYTRVKHCLHDDDFQQKFNDEFDGYAKDKDTILAFNFTQNGIKKYGVERYDETLGKEFADQTKVFKPKKLWDHLQKDNLYYVPHHSAHAAHAFISSGYEESDILAIDGEGWEERCVFFDSKTQTANSLGDVLQIGWLWNIVTKILGFSQLNEGKVMGLAGYGEMDNKMYALFEMMFDEFNEYGKKYYPSEFVLGTIKNNSKWNVNLAYTLQKFTEDKIREHIFPLKTSENLCVAGGVAYNGYMNELLTKHWKNVYVPQAPGDEGQGIACYLHANYVLNGKTDAPKVYNGEEYKVDESIFDGLTYAYMEWEDLCETIATEIEGGSIVGWFQGTSESGNRALGNRSILADPRNPDIKDIINSRVKMREDFRPFAPSVLEEHYQEYFDTNQPSPHMSRIMPVISDKIPGVTHVDGTARIQTVNKEDNCQYYDIINSFYKRTDIPMLLNTSFNCQEPIVETPEDAVNTFKKCGLDILVVGNYVVRK